MKLTCNNSSPQLEELFADLFPPQVTILSVGTLLTCVTLVIFAEECCHLFRHVHNRDIRIRLIWMRSLYPVFSFTSYICLIMPRAVIFSHFVSTLFLGLAVYEFYQLVVTYFGNEASMLSALQEVHSGICVRMPPLACCCFFLRDAKLTRRNMDRIKYGIFQVVLIRPIFKFVATVLWANGSYVTAEVHWNSPFIYLKALSAVSTMLAMYSLCTLTALIRVPLSKYSITLKKLSIQILLVVSGFQGFTISMLAVIGAIPCLWNIHPHLLALEIHYGLLIIEVTVLGVLVRVFRRHVKHESGDNQQHLMISDVCA